MNEIKLLNEDRLIIKCIKGHYKQYKNSIKFLVGEIYALDLKYVDKYVIQNHMMKIYSKLWEYGYIKLGDNPVLSLLQKFNELGKRPLAPEDLYTMLRWDISNVKVEGLRLDDVDDSVFSECELKDNEI